MIQSLKKSVEVIRSLFRWKHIDQLFLVPITMWTMIETGFLQAQFTRVRKLFFNRSNYGNLLFKAFINCLVGIR